MVKRAATAFLANPMLTDANTYNITKGKGIFNVEWPQPTPAPAASETARASRGGGAGGRGISIVPATGAGAAGGDAAAIADPEKAAAAAAASVPPGPSGASAAAAAAARHGLAKKHQEQARRQLEQQQQAEIEKPQKTIAGRGRKRGKRGKVSDRWITRCTKEAITGDLVATGCGCPSGCTDHMSVGLVMAERKEVAPTSDFRRGSSVRGTHLAAHARREDRVVVGATNDAPVHKVPSLLATFGCYAILGAPRTQSSSSVVGQKVGVSAFCCSVSSRAASCRREIGQVQLRPGEETIPLRAKTTQRGKRALRGVHDVTPPPPARARARALPATAPSLKQKKREAGLQKRI